jgi:inosine-uridine nucleoside N-ribohydrolase
MKAVLNQTGHCSFFINHFSFCIFALSAALLCHPELAVSAPATTSAPEPARIIFDTDMGNDIDDAMALALLHALQSRGECQVLAVTLTKNDPLAGPFVDAINTFYGRGEIPVGVRPEGGKKNGSRYLKLVEARDGDHLRYPHDLDNDTAPEAKELIRKTLSAQPDGSVTLVQVGFFANLAGLLDAPEDRELIRRKVRLLCIMGGSFQKIENHSHFLEYNVMTEIPPAQKLARDWPTPIVWSGFEIGIALPYPAVSIERDFHWTPHHIVAEAYYLYQPPPHERPTWDLTAALYAVRPDRGYFDLSPPGRVTVEADGFTRFDPAADGRDRFLILRPDQQARTREALVQLVTQPPLQLENSRR